MCGKTFIRYFNFDMCVEKLENENIHKVVRRKIFKKLSEGKSSRKSQ